jgi:hypothetical protein
MALTAQELGAFMREMEQRAASAGLAVNYTKAQISAMVQACEDTWDLVSTKNLFNNAMDTAAAPYSPSTALKRQVRKLWLQSKAGRE